MREWVYTAAALVLIGITLSPSARADDSQPSGMLAPLAEEVRIKWMNHIIRGVIGLAIKSDPENERYRYCVSGFTDQAAEDIALAMSQRDPALDQDRPWLIPILVPAPDYRPSTKRDDCRGGHILFGDIGADTLTMLNTHRRKQWLTIPNWPPYEVLELKFQATIVSGVTEELTLAYADQHFARERSLADDLSIPDGAVKNSCEASAYPIVFYFAYDRKRVEGGSVWSSDRISGSGYRLACLSVMDNTLHIDLTERLYNGIDPGQN